MEELWRADRTTEQRVRTTRKVERQICTQHFTMDPNDHNIEYIPIPKQHQFDTTPEQAPRSLPQMDSYNSNPTNSASSSSTSSS